MFGPESKPSLGLVKMYTAMAKARKPPTEIDLKAVEFNKLGLLKGVPARTGVLRKWPRSRWKMQLRAAL